MLVVNDVSKLEKYGFNKSYFGIYEKFLYKDDNTEISLLVNRLNNTNNNELYLVGYVESNKNFERYVKLDVIYDMIKDGVIKKV